MSIIIKITCHTHIYIYSEREREREREIPAVVTQINMLLWLMRNITNETKIP